MREREKEREEGRHSNIKKSETMKLNLLKDDNLKIWESNERDFAGTLLAALIFYFLRRP